MNKAATQEPTQELITVEAQPLVPVGSTAIMNMLDHAVRTGNLDLVKQVMDLQERFEKNEARKAFADALAAAKAEIPVITKNRHVGFESKKVQGQRTDYNHEDLAEIARVVDPILGKHGLHYRFRATSEINEPITVVCIVEHRLGHSIETPPLKAGRDESGNKNSIQQMGSAITYLSRYALKAALGLASGHDDDDGRASGGESEYLSPEQVAALDQLIKDTGGDLPKFLVFAKVEKLADIYADRYEAAVARVKEAGADRKAAAARKAAEEKKAAEENKKS